MSDPDISIEGAWKDYRVCLAEAFDALEDDQSIRIELFSEEAAPYVQALRVDDGLLLEASSNRVLDEQWKIDKDARKRLHEIGFEQPTETVPNYWIVLPMTHVDQAASMAVRALLDAFYILDPSYPDDNGVGWRPEPTPPAAGDDAPATFPESHEHLVQLVEHTLGELLGEVPERDRDGDLPIRFDHNVVFVRVLEENPSIRMFSLMAQEVSDRDAALREVARLNRTIDGVKFLLIDTTVIAAVELVAWPFAPAHLKSLLARLCDAVAKHEDDLVDSVGGRHFLEQPAPDEPEDDIHPAMLSILQLDAESPGSLRPKDVAKICDNNPDLLLELIRWNGEQELAWREARQETDDPEEARVCEIERKHAHRTVKLLRKALRRVLLG